MLHYIRYGIQLGLENVTISPFGPSTFAYHVGNIHLDYSATNVTLSVPGSGMKWITVEGLSGTSFHFTAGSASPGAPWPQRTCTTHSQGSVTALNGTAAFQVVVGDSDGACIVTLSKVT